MLRQGGFHFQLVDLVVPPRERYRRGRVQQAHDDVRVFGHAIVAFVMRGLVMQFLQVIWKRARQHIERNLPAVEMPEGRDLLRHPVRMHIDGLHSQQRDKADRMLQYHLGQGPVVD